MKGALGVSFRGLLKKVDCTELYLGESVQGGWKHMNEIPFRFRFVQGSEHHALLLLVHLLPHQLVVQFKQRMITELSIESTDLEQFCRKKADPVDVQR